MCGSFSGLDLMDWLTFVVEMTKALAWPASIFGVMFFYRRSLPNLVGRLIGLKVGEFEATFLSEASQVTKQVEKARAGITTSNSDLLDELEPLAQTSPRAAILESWFRIETEIRNLAQKSGINIERSSAPVLARKLKNQDVISEQTISAIRGLSALRNLAVHAPNPDLSSSKAIEFITLADAILSVLAMAKLPPSQPTLSADGAQ